MEEILYFLIPEFDNAIVSQDFKKLISWLSGQQDIVLTKETENKYKIAYKNRPHVSSIEFANQKIDVRIHFGDSYTIYNLKSFVVEARYRIYNFTRNYFIPKAYYIRDLSTMSFPPDIMKVFSDYGFDPVFVAETENNKLIHFAVKRDTKEVHIINPYLIDYYMNWGGVSTKSDEFSYVVADDINKFSLYADRGLIPFNFYFQYGKDCKILNFSNINLDKPDRKIFVKPIVTELNDPNFQFFTKQDERGSMIIMDKILEGETLDNTINRIINEQKMADSYLRAIVSKDVEFDKDKAGILTPRVTVFVYVDKLLSKPPKIDQSWDSINN